VTQLKAFRVVRRRVRVHRHRRTVLRFFRVRQTTTLTAPNRRGELVFTLSKADTGRLAKAKQMDIDLRLSATEGAATATTFETDLFVKAPFVKAPHQSKQKSKKKKKKKKHKPPKRKKR
jgi:hypothetical protein